MMQEQDPIIPPLPSGYTPVESQELPPLPSGYTPIEQPSPQKKSPVGSPSQGGLQGSQDGITVPSGGIEVPPAALPKLGGVETPEQSNLGAIGQTLEAGPREDVGQYFLDGKPVSRSKMLKSLQDRSFMDSIADGAGRDRIDIRGDQALTEFAQRQFQSRKTNDTFDSLMLSIARGGQMALGAVEYVDDLVSDLTGVPNALYTAVGSVAGPSAAAKAATGAPKQAVVEAIDKFRKDAEFAEQQRFQVEGDFIDLVSKGDFQEAANMAINTTAESAVPSLLIGLGTAVTGGGAGFAALARGGAAVTPLFIGGEYVEQKAQMEDIQERLTESQKFLSVSPTPTRDEIALMNLSKAGQYLRPAARGAAEMGGEALSFGIWKGTAKLATQSMKSLVGKTGAALGKEAAEEAAKVGAGALAKNLLGSMVVDPATEGFAELGTYAAQELTDVLLGVSTKSPARIMREGLNAWALGAASGGVMTAPGTATTGIVLTGKGLTNAKKYLDNILAFDPSGVSELNNAVGTMRERGQEQQASAIKENLAKREKAVKAVPNDKVSDTETVDTVQEIQELEERKKGLLPVYQEPIQAEIDAKTEKLKESQQAAVSANKKLTEITRKAIGGEAEVESEIISGGTESNKQTQADPEKQPKTEAVSKSELNKIIGPAVASGPIQKQPLKPIPTSRDQFTSKLSDFSDVVYRETDSDGLLTLADPMRFGDVSGDYYFSNDPDLALGQGGNKGFIIEADASKLKGSLNTSMPAYKVAYNSGSAELIARYNDKKDFLESILSVTVKPGAVHKNKAEKAKFNSMVSGWGKIENADGSVTYRKPVGRTGEAATEVTPTEAVEQTEEVAPAEIQQPTQKQDGKDRINRLSPREEQGRSRSGRANEEATKIIGGLQETSGEDPSAAGVQEAAVTQHAKDSGIWVESTADEFGEHTTKGEESFVWMNPETGVVTKAIGTHMHENVQEVLDRIAVHNTLFPSTEIKVKGFGKDPEGNFAVIIEQPDITAERGATEQEVFQDMTDRGFRPVNPMEFEDGSTVASQWTDGETIIEDLHPGNVLVDKDGNFHYIDPVIRLNTPEAGYGGTRELYQIPTDAVQEQSTESVPVRQQPEARQGVREEDTQGQETPQEGEAVKGEVVSEQLEGIDPDLLEMFENAVAMEERREEAMTPRNQARAKAQLYNGLGKRDRRSPQGVKLLAEIQQLARENNFEVQVKGAGGLVVKENGKEIRRKPVRRAAEDIAASKEDKERRKRVLQQEPMNTSHLAAILVAGGARFNKASLLRFGDRNMKYPNWMVSEDGGIVIDKLWEMADDFGMTGIITQENWDGEAIGDFVSEINAYATGNGRNDAFDYADEMYQRANNNGYTDAEVADIAAEMGQYAPDPQDIADNAFLDQLSEEEISEMAANIEQYESSNQFIQDAERYTETTREATDEQGTGDSSQEVQRTESERKGAEQRSTEIDQQIEDLKAKIREDLNKSGVAFDPKNSAEDAKQLGKDISQLLGLYLQKGAISAEVFARAIRALYEKSKKGISKENLDFIYEKALEAFNAKAKAEKPAAPVTKPSEKATKEAVKEARAEERKKASEAAKEKAAKAKEKADADKKKATDKATEAAKQKYVNIGYRIGEAFGKLAGEIRGKAEGRKEGMKEGSRLQKQFAEQVNEILQEAIAEAKRKSPGFTVTATQLAASAKKLLSINFNSPLSIERAVEYVDKVLNNATYSNDLSTANKLKKANTKRLERNDYGIDDGSMRQALKLNAESLSVEELADYLNFLSEISRGPYNRKRYEATVQKYAEMYREQKLLAQQGRTEEEKEASEKRKEAMSQSASEAKQEAIDEFEFERTNMNTAISEAYQKDYSFIKTITKAELESLSEGKLRELSNSIRNMREGIAYASGNTSEVIRELKARRMAEAGKEITEGRAFKQLLRDVFMPFKVSFSGLMDRTSTDRKKKLASMMPMNRIDSMMKGFTDSKIHDTFIQPISTAYSSFTEKMNQIDKGYDRLYSKVGKSIIPWKREQQRQDEMVKLSFIAIQKEFESNVGNDEVSSVADYIEAIKEAALVNDDYAKFAERYISIYESMLDSDGNFNYEEQEALLDKDTKTFYEYAESINQANADYVEVSAIRNKENVSLRQAYTPISVALIQYSNLSEIQNMANTFSSDENVKPTTQSGNIKKRTRGSKPLYLDFHANAKRATRSVLMDYYMREPLRSVSKAFNLIAKDSDMSPDARSFFSAIESNIAKAVRNTFVNEYYEPTGAKAIAELLKKRGYQMALASIPRAGIEFASNFAHAAMYKPKELAMGAMMLQEYKGNDEDLRSLAIFAESAQVSRMFEKSTSLMAEQGSGTRGSSTVYGRAIDRFSDAIMSAPDRAIARPLWLGSFSRTFEAASGEKLDISKMVNDPQYRLNNEAAIQRARNVADANLSQGFASLNPFEGVVASQITKDDNIIETFDKYMTRFMRYEFQSAVDSLNGLVGNNELSKAEAARLLGATILRMSAYQFAMSYAVDGFYSLIEAVIGTGPDDEEEEDDELSQKIGSSIAGTIIALLVFRRLGNLAKVPIGYAIETLNSRFGEELGMRNGEYDSYKDSMVFSQIPGDANKGDMNLEKLAPKFMGPYGAVSQTGIRFKNLLFNAGDPFGGKIIKPSLKDPDAIDKAHREIAVRIVPELFMETIGLPVPRDVKNLILREVFKDYEEGTAQGRAVEGVMKAKQEASEKMDAALAPLQEKISKANPDKFIGKDDALRAVTTQGVTDFMKANPNAKGGIGKSPLADLVKEHNMNVLKKRDEKLAKVLISVDGEGKSYKTAQVAAASYYDKISKTGVPKQHTELMKEAISNTYATDFIYFYNRQVTPSK